MRLTITGHHLELTDALKAHVEEKLSHLKTAFDRVIDVHVVLEVEKQQHICEVRVHAPGDVLHAKAAEQNLYAAIDVVIDKLNRQLARYKAKRKPHLRNHEAAEARRIKENPAEG